MTTLLEQIQALPDSAALVAARDDGAIAAALSVGRKKPNAREIGNGTILETIGLAAGNALLDVINTVPDFRHVKPLVEQGRLVIGAPLVQATVHSLVPSVLTQPQADALCALGFDDDPISVNAVSDALNAGGY
jgi:hypothetical protein